LTSGSLKLSGTKLSQNKSFLSLSLSLTHTHTEREREREREKKERKKKENKILSQVYHLIWKAGELFLLLVILRGRS